MLSWNGGECLMISKYKMLNGIAVFCFILLMTSSTVFATQKGAGGTRDRQNAGEVSCEEVENWRKLPEEKKQEIYKLENDVLAAKKRVLDQYVDYGILSDEKAEDIMQRLTNRQMSNQKDKKMPLFGRGHRR